MFPRRYIRLGPDDNLGKPMWVYCVWQGQHFFKTQPAKIIRKLWRDQHERVVTVAVKDRLAGVQQSARVSQHV